MHKGDAFQSMNNCLITAQDFTPGVVQGAKQSWPGLGELFYMKFLVVSVTAGSGERAFSSLVVAFGLRGLAELTRKMAYINCVPTAFYSEHDGQLTRVVNITLKHRGGEWDYGEPLRATLSVPGDMDYFAEIYQNPYAPNVYEITYSQEFIEMEMLYDHGKNDS